MLPLWKMHSGQALFMSNAYVIRAAQLDLARQMETPDFIRQFIDFIAGNGFNTLLLYLEGRIRTQAFPWPAAEWSYTPEQMRQIVAYAARMGVDVIPCVSCLGHAEQFLQHAALEHLAEVREGATGRFGGTHRHAFCPSNPATRSFLEQYLREISAIFPSPYVHVGLDEVFDMACCPDCQTDTFAQEQQLFLDHLIFCHELVTRKLGRQMMMWDDMFEFYPDILQHVPRDVIMVCWQYQTDVQRGEGHFLNLVKRDALRQYDALGLRYLIAPWDASVSNTVTFTRYAQDHRPMGGLITMWEKQRMFIHRTLPAIAFAGRLWSGQSLRDERAIFTSVVRDLLGSDDEQLVKAWRAAADPALPTELSLPVDGDFEMRQSWFMSNAGLDYAGAAAISLIHACLRSTASLIRTELGRRILQDMLPVYAFHELRFILETLAAERWNAGKSIAQDDRLRACINAIRQLREERHEQWNDWRQGIAPAHYAQLYDRTIASLESLTAEKASPGGLMVRFCLPDKYSAPQCRVSLKYGDTWEVIAQGVFKGRVPGEGVYAYWFAIDPARQPVAACVEIWGAGG